MEFTYSSDFTRGKCMVCLQGMSNPKKPNGDLRKIKHVKILGVFYYKANRKPDIRCNINTRSFVLVKLRQSYSCRSRKTQWQGKISFFNLIQLVKQGANPQGQNQICPEDWVSGYNSQEPPQRSSDSRLLPRGPQGANPKTAAGSLKTNHTPRMQTQVPIWLLGRNWISITGTVFQKVKRKCVLCKNHVWIFKKIQQSKF